MKNQVLTKEQMNELIALGVDVSKASMCRVSVNLGTPATDESKLVENDVNYYGMSFPVFTVTDILEMMPDDIELNGYSFKLQIEKETRIHYSCRYYSYEAEYGVYGNILESLKDSVYMTLIELVKLGKL